MSNPTGKRVPYNGTTPVAFTLSRANRNGVQLIFEGFTADDATVTVTFRGGATDTVTPPTTTGKKVIVFGEGWEMEEVEVSGVGAGSHYVTAVQL